MNILSTYKKITTLFILSFTMVSLVGCETKKYCDLSSECVYLLPDFWFFLRWGLIILLGFLSFIGLCNVIASNGNRADSFNFFLALLLFLLSLFGFNLFRTPIWESKNKSKVVILSPLEKVERSFSSLDNYIKDELDPLISEYDKEFQKLYDQLEDKLRYKNIYNHEDILRKCADYEYLEICNILERTAILKYSLNWLNSKREEVDYKRLQLEQNKWKLEKIDDLDEIALGNTESEEINKLVNYSEAVLEDSLSPPDSQDIAKFQQEIFNQIINNKRYGY